VCRINKHSRKRAGFRIYRVGDAEKQEGRVLERERPLSPSYSYPSERGRKKARRELVRAISHHTRHPTIKAPRARLLHRPLFGVANRQRLVR